MNKANRIFALALVVAFAVAIPASANCIPNKDANTFGNPGPYVYWVPPAPADQGALVGRFWQMGNRAAGNEGTSTSFLYFTASGINMNAQLGNAEFAACPVGRLLTVAQVPSADNSKSFFVAASVDETTTGGVDFPYQNLGNLSLIELPKPSVVTSARVATNVNLTANLASVSSGLVGSGAATSVTGYRILSASGAADPGRLAAAYPSVEATVASTGGPAAGVAFDVDCSNPATDRWVVAQITFDQGVQSDLVSQAVRVNCNPSIADPTVPTINKPGKGKGRPTLRP